MRKRILFAAVAMTILLTMGGCGANTVKYAEDKDVPSMFVVVESTLTWYVVRHKETGVMYAVSRCAYNSGNFTMLVNADSSPMVWEP